MAVTRGPLTLKQRGTGRRAEIQISGIINITAAGAVLSVQCEEAPNIAGTLARGAGVILKNAAAGRYDIAFLRKYKNLRVANAAIIKAGGGAFGNTVANIVNWRVATAGSDCTIQGYLASTGADTDFASGDSITFDIAAQEY